MYKIDILRGFYYMLKVSLIEFVLRIIPESFLFLLAAYVFANKKIEKKLYIISGFIIAISMYFIRLLPIQFGIHSVIGVIIVILVAVNINKIPTSKAISSAVMIIIFEGIFETINLVFIDKVLNLNVQAVLSDSVSKLVYFAPSLIILGCSIGLFNILVNNKKNKIL